MNENHGYLIAEGRQRGRIKDLEEFEQQFAKTGNDLYKRKAERIEKEIAKAQEKWQFPPLE